MIAKVESQRGLANCREIAAHADAVLIDRGDLSREIPMERVPMTQKAIIDIGKEAGKPVYVATNLLESMVTATTPTRAEINDIYNTLLDGANGLVLAAETAIGRHPVSCARMLKTMILDAEARPEQGHEESDLPSLLPPPHGGHLVSCLIDDAELAEAERACPAAAIDRYAASDCRQIALGTFSPLDGFMTRETLDAVLDHHRLPGGPAWSMPLLLPLAGAAVGETVLRDETGRALALMEIEEVFTLDPGALGRRWFGTESADHPGVCLMARRGTTFAGGRIRVSREFAGARSPFELSPGDVRKILAHKAWARVVGFHGRNLPHRGHEFLQSEALARCRADGLLISPVIGFTKPGDIDSHLIVEAYLKLFGLAGYPGHRALLAGVDAYSRFAGPREAVFTALCRKNMGCSHFIVGRDHAGVGDFYPRFAAREIFDELGPIGVRTGILRRGGLRQAKRQARRTPGRGRVRGDQRHRDPGRAARRRRAAGLDDASGNPAGRPGTRAGRGRALQERTLGGGGEAKGWISSVSRN